MTHHNPFALPPIPDIAWDSYEDVTPLARRTGIKYPVYLDPRVRSLLERDIDPVEFECQNYNQPLAIYLLTALRFLLDRFPSMTRYRYSAGPGSDEQKVPVFVSFHHDDERGYFVALSLDIHGVPLEA